VELSIESDGNKMDKNFDINDSDSLGMTLIEVLVQRIDGQLEISQDEWTRFKITFDLKQEMVS
jgi:two-component sensor histidine kinase